MRVDCEARAVRISVRELAGEETGRWDVVRLPGRADLGREKHAQRRHIQSQAHPGYRGEISVTRTVNHRDYEVTIQGRIDGIYESSSGLLVEEFKSIALESHELSGLSAHDFPAARLQLLIYLSMISHPEGLPVLGRLTVVSLFDPMGEWQFDVAPDPDTLEPFIRARLDALLDEAEREAAWLARRRGRAAGLPFPHEIARSQQLRMAEEIQAAFAVRRPLLLEAPTGAGKSAAALFAALSFAYAAGKRLFFLTSKTSGQAPVIRDLEAMNARGAGVTAVVLTARDKICPQPVVYCHPDYCPLADRYQEKLFHSGLLDPVSLVGILGRDALTEASERSGLCPFELSLSLSTRVDAVICDYNYVFDPSVALRHIFSEDRYDDWIVVIDEAHNLVARAREYYSSRLSWGATGKLEAWGNGRMDSTGRRIEDVARQVREYLWECLVECGLENSEEGTVGFEPDVQRLLAWHRQIETILWDDPIRRRHRPSPGEEDVLLAYYRQMSSFVQGAQELAKRGDGSSTSFVERRADDMSLRIVCHDASRRLQKRIRGFHNALAMSATLTPSAFFSDQLGLGSDALTASFPSPFPREHRGVFIDPGIPDRFKDRAGAVPAIVRSIRTVITAHPGAYAVYLPSFEVLREIQSFLDTGEWEVTLQDSRMDDRMRESLIRRFAQTAGGEPYRARVLLAVLGGSLAEGIEWPAGVLSGVIILSPGLPRVGVEQEMLKHYFADQYDCGFEYAYLYPGMTRVLQAAGRLIRRPEDIGVVVLLGERFAERRYAALLPGCWFDRDWSEAVVHDLDIALREFWKRVGQEVDGTTPSDPGRKVSVDGQSQRISEWV